MGEATMDGQMLDRRQLSDKKTSVDAVIHKTVDFIAKNG
jgi:hypothetical protein